MLLILKALLPYLLVFILVLAFVVYLIYNKKLPQVKSIILSLVLEAEKKFGRGNGKVKYSYVVGMVYPRLPLTVRIFITDVMLGVIIEECVHILKDQLGYIDRKSESPNTEQITIQEQTETDSEMSTK